MATGIVEVFAKAGYDVVFVARGQDKVDGGVLAAIKKGQASDDRARQA
jgi:3-hydroxybutyryl-CoA dehydrogenase